MKIHFKLLCIFCFISAFFCLFGKLGSGRKRNRIVIEKKDAQNQIVVYANEKTETIPRGRKHFNFYSETQEKSALYEEYLKSRDILLFLNDDSDRIVAENLNNIVNAVNVSIDRDANIVITDKVDGPAREEGEFGERWQNFGNEDNGDFLGRNPGKTRTVREYNQEEISELEILKKLKGSLLNKAGAKN